MATYTWTGTISDDVSLAANYSPTNGPPGPGDTVNQNGTEVICPGSGSITVAVWNVTGTANEDGGDNNDFTITAGALNFSTSGIINSGTWNGPANFTRGNLGGGIWNGNVSITDTAGSVIINYTTFNNPVTLDTTGNTAHGITVNRAMFNAPVTAVGQYTKIGGTGANTPTFNSTLTVSLNAQVRNAKLGGSGSLVFTAQTLYSSRPFLPRAMSGGYNG